MQHRIALASSELSEISGQFAVRRRTRQPEVFPEDFG
jgi:hypothetical protein